MESTGTTLPELILVLLLLGVAAQALIQPVRRQADGLVVRGAREEVVALLDRARSEARLHGGASVVMENGADPVLLVGDPVTERRLDLGGRGVRLEVAGARSSVTLRYGPLGIAKWGSATLVLNKRDAESRVVISSYGRVRR